MGGEGLSGQQTHDASNGQEREKVGASWSKRLGRNGSLVDSRRGWKGGPGTEYGVGGRNGDDEWCWHCEWATGWRRCRKNCARRSLEN